MSFAASTQPITVLYIAGYERSGSTVLTKALGEMPGVFAAGELRNIWQRSFIDNIPCGCGQPFSDCELWNAIIERGYGGRDQAKPRWMIAHRPGPREVPLMVVPGGDRLLRQRHRAYFEELGRLYRAIVDVTGARIIVDSSKSVSYGDSLHLVPGLDVRVVHIVRDPRGIQQSLIRRKQSGHARLSSHNLTRNSMTWNVSNALHEVMNIGRRSRYIRIRYEDFVADPTETFRQIARLVGEPEMAVPTVSDGVIQLQPNHIMGGSPNRHETGSIALRPDNRWLEDMTAGDRKAVTRLTFPMLRHYGYPTTPGTESSPSPAVSNP
jgi:hypothetical protein